MCEADRLDIDNIKPVMVDEAAWDSLVVSESTKRTVEGLVKTHLNGIKSGPGKCEVDKHGDFVRGKGQLHRC